MPFPQQYTPEQVRMAIETHSNVISAAQIAAVIGCSKSTVDNLLKTMMDARTVTRINARSEAKPLWMYSIKRGD